MMSFKKIAFALVPTVVLLLSMHLVELYMRTRPMDVEFARTLFFTEFKTSRWRYLEKLQDRLAIKNIIDSPRNETFIEPPESNRPPFDRVPYEYEISYNNMGFRDSDFLRKRSPGKKRIMILGDSVAFGKGVSKEESFPELLERDIANVEVYNLGLQGCTSECKIQIFRRNVDVLNPDLVLIQASGNDIDQTLWKESYEDRLPGMSIVALEKTRGSFLLQRIMHFRGKDRIENQMKAAAAATKKRYRPYLEEIFAEAEKRNISIGSINLPFAYGKHYGNHLSELCLERPEICLIDLQMEFSDPERIEEKYKIKGLSNDYDFVDSTAKVMNVSVENLSPVFPARRFFHDICHLSPIGHAAVADVLKPRVESVLK